MGNQDLRTGRRVVPLFLYVVEQMVATLTLDDLGEIEKTLDKIVKQRDDLVAQLLKTMRFLATVMILILLIEIGAVRFGSAIWGLSLHADQSELIFGLLLIGNLIALLFAAAMMKMFLVEFTLRHYFVLKGEKQSSFIAGLAHRFYAFTFGLIAEQWRRGLPPRIATTALLIHTVTIIILPLTYIICYASVLSIAIVQFQNIDHSEAPVFGLQPVMVYSLVLIVFNVVTLSFYAFVFFPCLRPVVREDQLAAVTAENALRLWEACGRPEGKNEDIWLLAERQVLIRHAVLKGPSLPAYLDRLTRGRRRAARP